jgi:hypothetical protein
MKKFNAGEWVLLMFAFSVSAAIVFSVVGIVFKGSSSPTESAVVIRTALIDLLKVITGGVLSAIALTKTNKDA